MISRVTELNLPRGRKRRRKRRKSDSGCRGMRKAIRRARIGG